MKLPRRKFLHLAAGAAALPTFVHVTRAQAYPTRPVGIIYAFSGEPDIDVLNMLIAYQAGGLLSERLSQTSVTDPRLGATNLATEAVVRAAEQVQQSSDQFSIAARPSCTPMQAQNHLAFASDSATARIVLMNSSASGLSVRFFKVMIAIVPLALSNLTGNALSEGCLPRNINVCLDHIVRKRPVAKSLFRICME